MTTVAELIAHLQTLPQDAKVVIAGDPEDGGFSPIALDASGKPDADVGWHGQWGFHQDRNREHAGPDAVQAVCLWPTP